MLEGILRSVAILASGIVLLSFALFALDETRDASKQSAAAVAGLQATRAADPSPTEERARELAHNSVREAIDDVDDVLLRPFAAVIDSKNEWVQRGLPALFGLLLYGVGLLYLARMLKIRSRPIMRHRAAPPVASSTGSSPPPGS